MVRFSRVAHFDECRSHMRMFGSACGRLQCEQGYHPVGAGWYAVVVVMVAEIRGEEMLAGREDFLAVRCLESQKACGEDGF